MSSQIKFQAQILLARLYFEDLNPMHCMSWARSTLKAPRKSHSLLLLADKKSLHDDDVVRLFLQSVKELNLDLSEDKLILTRSYVYYLGERYLTGQINYKMALGAMLSISRRVEKNEQKILSPFIQVISEFKLDGDFKMVRNNLKMERKLVKKLRKVFFRFLEEHSGENYRQRFKLMSTWDLRKFIKNNNKKYQPIAFLIAKDVLRLRQSESIVERVIRKLKK